MDKKSVIYNMLEAQKKYRESFLEELIHNEKKYELLKILMNYALTELSGTYNIEKEILNYQKVFEMLITFEKKYEDIDLQNLKEIWQNSLWKLIDYENSYIDLKQYINFNLQQYREMIHIGNKADINRNKIEFDKLKIKYMEKKRR